MHTSIVFFLFLILLFGFYSTAFRNFNLINSLRHIEANLIGILFYNRKKCIPTRFVDYTANFDRVKS